MTTKVKVPVAEIEEFASWLASNANDLKNYIDTEVAGVASDVPPAPIPVTDDGKVLTANGGNAVWTSPNLAGVRQVPTGGAVGEVLTNDGSDNYSWGALPSFNQVPTPVSGTDDNKLLTANAGTFSWQPAPLTGRIATMVVLTSGAAQTWVWPLGVEKIRVTVIGGGQAGYSRTNSTGAFGTASSVTYNGVTVTANGGNGNLPVALNGDLNLQGSYRCGDRVVGSGVITVPGGSGFLHPYGSMTYGAGGNGATGTSGQDQNYVGGDGGGCSATAIKVFTKVVGQDTLTYTVGLGGVNSGFTGIGTPGKNGVIIIEY